MSEALIIFYVLAGWFVVFTAVGLVLRLRRGPPTAEDIELERLEVSWARGELSREEYVRRRRSLTERPASVPGRPG